MNSTLDQPTRWTLVWRAGHGSTKEMRLARDELARIYWQPVFHHIRRLGYTIEQSQDLTQGFFERLIELNLFARADRSRGRLRSYFFAILRHHLVDEWRSDRHAFHTVTLDDSLIEVEGDEIRPDRAFDREWALATIHRALETTEASYAAAGRSELFQLLRPFLSPDTPVDEETTYTELARVTGKAEGALRTAVFRLRRDFRAHLNSLVARTLDDPTPEAIRSEIRDLMECL